MLHVDCRAWPANTEWSGSTTCVLWRTKSVIFLSLFVLFIHWLLSWNECNSVLSQVPYAYMRLCNNRPVATNNCVQDIKASLEACAIHSFIHPFIHSSARSVCVVRSMCGKWIDNCVIMSSISRPIDTLDMNDDWIVVLCRQLRFYWIAQFARMCESRSGPTQNHNYGVVCFLSLRNQY